MLIRSPITANSVVTFRIITGETLLAKFVSQNTSHLTITRPICANPTQTETGGFGIFYTPFCPTADEDQEHRIPLSAIVLEPLYPRDELKASYIKMTTGLDIPQ